DGAVEALEPRRREIGERAAPAIADDGDLAVPPGLVDRDLYVEERLVELDLGAEVAPLRDVLGAVAELDSLLQAVEERRRHDVVALAREAVGDGADVAIDAEDLLKNDHRAARLACRLGHIGPELVAILRGELDHLAHGS